MLHGEPKQEVNLKEEVMPTPKKTKFGRKFIEDDESSYGSTEEMDLRTILIGTINAYSSVEKNRSLQQHRVRQWEKLKLATVPSLTARINNENWSL